LKMSLNLLRVNRLRREMSEEGVDFSLLKTYPNLFYFLGCNIEGFLLIPQESKRCILITDARYSLELQEFEDKNLKVYICRKSYLDELAVIFSRNRMSKTVALEPQLPLGIYFKLREKLKHIKVKPLSLTERIRAVKDNQEIENIKEAVVITKRTLQAIKPRLLLKTEVDIQVMLDFKFRKLGACGASFPPIVASGIRSAFPHAAAGGNVVRKKDGFLLIDCGAKFNGYCADLTRMYFWDRIPKVIKQAYQVIKEARDLAVSLVSDSVGVSGLVLKVEKFIEKNGFKNNVFHGLGHGVGINVHEEPSLNRNSKEVLKKGMVITIEPGLYFPGIGGVRIEEVVLVEKDKGVII